DPALVSALEDFRERRNQRARLMVQKLNDLDVDITFEDIEAAAGDAAIGRPHVADAMVNAGAVPSYDEAFRKYIRNGGPAYVSKQNFTPEEAISLVHQAGGMTVLAHPTLNGAVRHLEHLVTLGLDGIEVYHPIHSKSDVNQFTRLSERFRLVTTGGSDFHGRFNSEIYGDIGSQKVPAEWLERMKRRAGKE
ncbi:MAG: phosphatase, partial [Candidatus Zixiibacteriota bacterium]